ncbi:MAG: 4Fe-4S binding protein [Planctomycetota bacterium]
MARCTACGYCEALCPEDAVTLKHVARIDDSACSQCGLCIENCPVGAISWPQTER